MANKQLSPKPAKAATLQTGADLPAMWIGLESMHDDVLISLEQRIGEILESRNARPPINWSARVRACFARSVARVREAFISGSFYTTAKPEELTADSARVRACRSHIKRIVHRLAPSEIIALALFLEAAETVPVGHEHYEAIANTEAARTYLQLSYVNAEEASA
jgi:hypothetical protein